jgi:hypothetical protein
MFTDDYTAEDDLFYFDLTEDELPELEEGRFPVAHRAAGKKPRQLQGPTTPGKESANAADTRAAKEPRHSLSVRPTAAQLEKLHYRAEAAGYKSLARYLLERGLRPGRAIAAPERPQLERLLFEIRKINYQLAQLSRAFPADANTGEVIAARPGINGEPGPLQAAVAAQWQRALAAAEQTLLTVTEAFKR